MLKKLLVFSVFFGLADTLLVSCCKDSLLDYTKFNSVKISNASLQKELNDSSTVAKNNYRIKCKLDGDFIAFEGSRPLFTNNSYATSCENMGLLGLKNDIVKFEISCNREILGIPAGQQLNPDKIKAYEIGFYDDAKNPRLTINDWINIFNKGRREQSSYELYFEFDEEIISSDFLKFKFSIEFQDGSVLEAETNNIRII